MAAHDLEGWLTESYATAYRTAWLILRNRADAEEAVQEAFLRAWRFRESARDADARPWLYRVLVNTCCSRLRHEMAARARTAVAIDGLDGMAWEGVGPDESAQRAELGVAVTAAVATLPEHLRIPVVLRYYAGLSEREVATAIGRRPGTVKSRLHEARRRLAANPALSALAEVDL
jgi:RNA polymerase sigma-70 factor (ECF subfamily)